MDAPSDWSERTAAWLRVAAEAGRAILGRWGDARLGRAVLSGIHHRAQRGYIKARSEALHSEGIDPHTLLLGVQPAPHARELLRRFVRLAR